MDTKNPGKRRTLPSHNPCKLLSPWQIPALLELIHTNAQLGDLTRNGLLLTLTCVAAARHDLPPDTARRVDLYRFIVSDMVQGGWKDSAYADDDPHVSLVVRVLQNVAWKLFSLDPQRTVFQTMNGSPRWHELALTSICDGVLRKCWSNSARSVCLSPLPLDIGCFCIAPS